MYKKLYLYICIYVLLQTLFLIDILFIKYSVALVSFLSILVNGVFAWIFAKNKNTLFINMALSFTIFADLCLVLISPIKQLSGMIFFSYAQILYAVYLFSAETNQKRLLTHAIVRVVVIVISQIAMVLVVKDNVDALSIVSVFYFANLIVNIIFAFCNRQTLLFAIALVMFLICDIFIGLAAAVNVYFVVSESSLLYKLAFSSFNWAWLFYLPSQVLITIYMMLTNKKTST